MKQENPQRKNIIWLFALIITCTLILVFFIFYKEYPIGMSNNGIAILIKNSLFYGLIIITAFHIIIDKHQAKMKENISYLIIFVCIISGQIIGATQYDNAGDKMISELADYYIGHINANPDISLKPLDTTIQTTGQYGELEEFLKETINKRIELTDEYTKKMNDIGWQNIFSLIWIKNDPLLTKSKNMIKKSKEIIANYKEKLMTANTMALLRASQLNNKMYEAFSILLQQSRKQIELDFNNELIVVEKIEKIINFLESKQGQWKISDNKLSFYTDTDTNQYNKLVDEYSQSIQ
ncbi:MAG: hypothetical protein KGV56_01185 [Gammaproteobacteria bacterium]|nr:hypothetical protein [Gammaproteobacteria bacterium]